MSLHAWNILSPELVGASVRRADEAMHHKEGQNSEVTIPMALFRYCQEIIDPPCELSIYIRPLANTTSLVYLCIDNVTGFESNELLSLAQLHQLAVLELIEREARSNCISDRLIRGWTEMMKSQSCPAPPFHKLRVLKIMSRTHAVSEGSLHRVLEFPALEIYDITALPAQRWRRARDIAAEHGWKAIEPEDSVFVSYANAYLDGRAAVHPSGVDGLRTAFEDDRLRLSLADNPRRGRREGHDQASFGGQGREGEVPPSARSSHLDDGWRAVLQGNLLSSTTDERQVSGQTHHQPDLSDNEVFWFLSLLDQKQHGEEGVERNAQAQLAGVPLLRDRFISLRLRTPPVAAEQHRAHLGSQRLIFSRRQTEAAVAKASESHAPEPSWAARPDDRRERNLKPRKRQKVGDMFSSFGM